MIEGKLPANRIIKRIRRVYLRVHYASDVLAGFLIGLIWLLVSLAVIDGIEEYFLTAAKYGYLPPADLTPGGDKQVKVA